jgi:hypothetical protein
MESGAARAKKSSLTTKKLLPTTVSSVEYLISMQLSSLHGESGLAKEWKMEIKELQ